MLSLLFLLLLLSLLSLLLLLLLLLLLILLLPYFLGYKAHKFFQEKSVWMLHAGALFGVRLIAKYFRPIKSDNHKIR